MAQITYDQWKELKMRVGKVVKVERIPKTEKLYKLQVDIGGQKQVQIVSSLVPYYEEEEILGKQIVVLVNLEPATFGGEVSEGMLLCAETEDADKCVILRPEREMPTGTPVT